MRALGPLIICGIIGFGALAAVVFCTPPTTAGDWGSIVSAAVSIAALGALLTTLSLQRQELSLQRIEIARLATHAQEQSLQGSRQTLIESYRAVDERVAELFNDGDFVYLIERSLSPNNMKYIIDNLDYGHFGIDSFIVRGLHNCSSYKFITNDHVFPIMYQLKENNNKLGDYKDALLPIRRFCILSGIIDAAAIARPVYEIAENLDLLEYTRSIMLRKCYLEPFLYITSRYKHTEVAGDSNLLCAPDIFAEDITESAAFHVQNRLKFYNLLTARLAKIDINVDLFSSEAERAISPSDIIDYPSLLG